MTAARTTQELSNLNAAYIAGLIDADGTVTLCRKHRNENHQLAVSISNTDLSLLQFVLDTIGTGKITRKRVTQPQHTPSFVYAVYNRQALSLLTQISPYLRTYKQVRATLIIRDYLRVTPRNGKYSEKTRIEREQFVETILNTKSRKSHAAP